MSDELPLPVLGLTDAQRQERFVELRGACV
jgi:hypothetical protein